MDDITDAIGLLCPLPVLRVQKALANASPGAQVRIRTSDPVAVIDIPHFCVQSGHDLIESIDEGDTHLFTLARGPNAPAKNTP